MDVNFATFQKFALSIKTNLCNWHQITLTIFNNACVCKFLLLKTGSKM